MMTWLNVVGLAWPGGGGTENLSSLLETVFLLIFL